MSEARQKLDWEGCSILPLTVKRLESTEKVHSEDKDTCTMCGKMCAMKIPTKC